MSVDIIPFAHDYYIMSLPSIETKISPENRETLFGVL